MDDKKRLAEFTVKTALSAGAETAEVNIIEESEFDVNTRNGSIETLTESVSNRIFILVSAENKRASVSSSDLSAASIESLTRKAVQLARVMEYDEFFSLPDKKELGSAGGGLQIFDEEILTIPTEKKISLAQDLEATARKLDSRIVTDQSSYSNTVQKNVIANSLGFCEGYSSTYNSITLSCAAEDDGEGKKTGKKQSAFWYSASTLLSGLDSIEKVATEAVSRTLRKLGSVKPKTCEVPVVFDAFTARAFLRFISEAVRGQNVYKRSSFLAGRIRERIAPEEITVVDDPLLKGKIGSRPFDDEGVRSRTNTVIEKGVLRSYLMNTYEARKLGTATTGNDGGVSNFYLKPGKNSEREIISSVENGLYLNFLSGQGANWSTGDFSQGAQGMWIEDGEITYPVSEFTIAGTFSRMLEGIEMVGDDIEWKNPVASPPFKIGKIVISGA